MYTRMDGRAGGSDRSVRPAALAPPPAGRFNEPQLLHQSMPAAAAMLAVLVPVFEPVGLPSPLVGGAWGAAGTLLGYRFTAPALAAILGSAALG